MGSIHSEMPYLYQCMYVLLCEEMKAVQKAKLAEKQQMLSQLAKMNEDLAASVKHVSAILRTHTYTSTHMQTFKK